MVAKDETKEEVVGQIGPTSDQVLQGVDDLLAGNMDTPEARPLTDTSHELSGEEILTVDDRKLERVDVPEWGGHVWVRGLSGTERDTFERSVIQGKGRNREVNLENFRSKLIVLAAVSKDGVQLFSRSQVSLLGTKSAAALQRVFAKAQDLSGLGDEDVEELTKELGKDLTDDSGSV